jgi:outer membrane biosynthesis protein TonB
MEDLRKETGRTGEEERELETPMDLPKTDEQEKKIQDEQQQSSEQLEKKQNQKAGASQKKAAEQMEQLAFQMKSAMQSGPRSSRKRTWTPCASCWRTSYSSASNRKADGRATGTTAPRTHASWSTGARSANCAMMPR